MVTDRVCITLTQSIVDDKNVNGLVGRLDKFMSEKSIQIFSASGNLVGLKKYYHMLLGFFLWAFTFSTCQKKTLVPI